MGKSNKTIDPIDGEFEKVAEAIAKPAPPKGKEINALGDKPGSLPAPPVQGVLDLGIEVEKAVEGIEMGVLENGIPYLTQAGLSKATGAQRSVIYDITQDWEKHFDDPVLTKDRLSFIREYLAQKGYTEPKLYIETKRDGNSHYAYPDIVCMALLEYYAFESKSPNPEAVDAYRRFAAFGLRKFIYDSLGYTPGDKWKYHNDRVSLLKDSAPTGYFTIFREITGMVVDLITANLTINDKTVPDISVGRAWSDFWKSEELALEFGERITYEHNYPDYYPQALSNPQTPYAYPDAALPKFRKWFRENYLPTKFPRYILRKAQVISGGKQEAEKIAAIYQEKSLPNPD